MLLERPRGFARATQRYQKLRFAISKPGVEKKLIVGGAALFSAAIKAPLQ
jgi:hypothetical protein